MEDEFKKNIVNNLSLQDKAKLEEIFFNENPDIDSNSVVGNPFTGESISPTDGNTTYIDTSNPHIVLEDEAVRLDSKIRTAAIYPRGNVEMTLDEIRQNEPIESYNYAVDYAKKMGYTNDEKLRDYQQGKYSYKNDDMMNSTSTISSVSKANPTPNPNELGIGEALKTDESIKSNNMIEPTSTISPTSKGEVANPTNLDYEKRGVYDVLMSNSENSRKDDEDTNYKSVNNQMSLEDAKQIAQTQTNQAEERAKKEEEINRRKAYDYMSLEDAKQNAQIQTEQAAERAKKEEEINNKSSKIRGLAGVVTSGLGSSTSSIVSGKKDSLKTIDSDDIKQFIGKTYNLDDLNNIVRDNIKEAINQLSNINYETIVKLQLVDLNELYDYSLTTGIPKVHDKVVEIRNLLSGANTELGNIDLEGTTGTEEVGPTIKTGLVSVGDYYPSSGSSDISSQITEYESVEQSQVPEEETSKEEETPIVDISADIQKLIALSFGSLKLSDSIGLLNSNGELIQGNPEVEYGILGIEKRDDELYYIIIDKTTGTIYYAKINDINLENIELKILHVKENALILNSTDIGADDNFVKLAEPDSYYLVTESQEIGNVNFVTVIDSQDGNKYYIPISDSVEILSSEQLNLEGNTIINDSNVSQDISTDATVSTGESLESNDKIPENYESELGINDNDVNDTLGEANDSYVSDFTKMPDELTDKVPIDNGVESASDLEVSNE